MKILNDTQIKKLNIKDCSSIDNNVLERFKYIMNMSNAYGLAAPQLGIAERFVVIRYKSKFRIMINPKIQSTSKEKTKCIEGCMSIPLFKYKVSRYDRVRVSYINEIGNTTVKNFEGKEAQIIQHELDHLDKKSIKDEGTRVCLKRNLVRRLLYRIKILLYRR